MADNYVASDDVEKEKRMLKKIMPPEKRIEEQKALQKAKEIENEIIPGKKQELREGKKFMEESEQAKSLLKPQWYLKKTDVEKKKKNK